MGTAERHKASGSGGAVEAAARGVAPREVGAVRREADVAPREVGVNPSKEARPEPRPPLWIEEPARRRRLPDPVRTAAVRAVIIVAVTLVQAMVAFLTALAGSWLSFPMVLSSVASTVVATWGVLDVWVTRQVWNQRHGVVSMPSSTARRLRRERRRARRLARVAARGKERIRRRPGQLSHS
ncbi:hypothetical protein [Streptomyces sp. NRRL S-920]|uniref:hypothetical protein n=1 Tax=Streptomyces sp. NRRL S-920 TaxID=1463921 RepID=UPI0004C4D172|nr:hypothetical protein [Streptomyces sp. NRRL S-920]